MKIIFIILLFFFFKNILNKFFSLNLKKKTKNDINSFNNLNTTDIQDADFEEID